MTAVTQEKSEMVYLNPHELAWADAPASLLGSTLSLKIEDTAAPYLMDEIDAAASFFRATRRRGTDLDATCNLVSPASMRIPNAIQIRSKNFGYDFVLTKSLIGRRIFGKHEYQFAVFRAIIGTSTLSFIEAHTSLNKALHHIESLYEKAALAHLA